MELRVDILVFFVDKVSILILINKQYIITIIYYLVIV